MSLIRRFLTRRSDVGGRGSLARRSLARTSEVGHRRSLVRRSEVGHASEMGGFSPPSNPRSEIGDLQLDGPQRGG